MNNIMIMNRSPFRMLTRSVSCSASAIGQCDACSPVISSYPLLHAEPKHSEAYRHARNLVSLPVGPDHHVLAATLSGTFSVVNSESFTVFHRFETPSLLRDVVNSTSITRNSQEELVTQMIQAGVLCAADSDEHPEISDCADTLSAWMHITERCNLRCAYCYVPHTASASVMSEQIGQQAINALCRSAQGAGVRRIKLKYAGGEPLLSLSRVSQLQQYARRCVERHDLLLDGVVISNGTLLTPHSIQTLQELNLRLTVSLDAIREGGPRVDENGRDASEAAMRGIDAALSAELKPDVSITVSPGNLRQLPELLEWVLDRQLCFSLNFYRPPSHSTLESKTHQSGDVEAFITGMLAAYAIVEAYLPPQSLLTSLADMANLATPHLRRCSVGQSYLVFAPDGQVSQCQMHMNSPLTNVHAADPLAELRAANGGIRNLTVNEKEGCEECKWKYWCAGGCPLETYRLTGRYDVRSPNCAIYKALYPEVLRLEGKRLLKYAGDLACE